MYNYQENIKINKTVSGDIVLTMNEAILTTILNCIYDSCEYRKNEGLTTSAEDTNKLWNIMYDKSNAIDLRNDYSTIKRLINRRNDLTEAEKEVLIEILKVQ